MEHDPPVCSQCPCWQERETLTHGEKKKQKKTCLRICLPEKELLVQNVLYIVDISGKKL